MGRSPRLTYGGALHHVTMRCNNKEFLFDEESFRQFLGVLLETCEKFHTPLYNYCLMTNHVHLLFEVGADDVLSRFMHRLANVFAKRFNAARDRKGHLWEGRFVSTIVEARSYFFRCMAYIDLNPVRAGMAEAPGDHEWCAHRHVVAENELAVAIHDLYKELGRTPAKRRRAYLRLLEAEAGRPPYSLAGTLLVGSPRFTRRLQKRFGITLEARSRFQRLELDDGIRAIELRKGGRARRCDWRS